MLIKFENIMSEENDEDKRNSNSVQKAARDASVQNTTISEHYHCIKIILIQFWFEKQV